MTPKQLCAARKSLGLTPAQIAPLLGYSSTSRVYEIENGRRNPSAAAIMLLRAYLDGYRPEDWPIDECKENGRSNMTSPARDDATTAKEMRQ